MPKKYGPGSAPYDDRVATSYMNKANRSAAGHGPERLEPGTKTKLGAAFTYDGANTTTKKKGQ